MAELLILKYLMRVFVFQAKVMFKTKYGVAFMVDQ